MQFLDLFTVERRFINSIKGFIGEYYYHINITIISYPETYFYNNNFLNYDIFNIKQ